MWKEYSSGYIKNNRASGISVVIAAFISALLLSLLCGIFYNLWKYEVERIELENGAWHSQISQVVEPSDQHKTVSEEIESIKQFANIKKAVINERKLKEGQIVIDLYFHSMRDALKDTPQIAKYLGLSPQNVTYNYELLAMYMVRDSGDPSPRMLFPLFLLITGMASVSLIFIIHNSFAVSMNARIRQFGIFSSLGATPKQIRTCLLQEAAALCVIPVLAGNLLGIAGSMGLLNMTNHLLGKDVPGRHDAVFGYSPLIFGVTLFVTGFTVGISAWLPAGKLSRLTPLEAIKNTEELHLKRRKRLPLLSLLWGVEGELAGNALKAQRKALRTASLSLVFSFLAFTIMQCFFTLSGISTEETYFERYQDVWDIMVTMKDTEITSFKETKKIRQLSGVKSAIIYQKASAKRIITENEISEEMKSLGGFSRAPARYVTKTDGGWEVNAPIIILDDASFLTYCEQIGTTPRLDGVIILNQIRDVTNPDFRHPQYMPYINERSTTSTLLSLLPAGSPGGKPGAANTAEAVKDVGEQNATKAGEKEPAELSVLDYTEKVPVLREEYATLDYYELVHFIPVSLWEKVKNQITGDKTDPSDTRICIRGQKNITLQKLNVLQKKINQIIGEKYMIESENRIQEYKTNQKQIKGMMIILGGFCVLLATIGIGSIFSNTLGFVRQRKREVARYMSVGMTPKQIRKMFCIEALVIAGRPILLTIPLAVLAVGYMLKASYLEINVFLNKAPFLSLGIFAAAILGSVAIAYTLGWKNVRKIDLSKVLRDDTMI